MVYNRTGYAPWSLTREAGVQSATVDGTIEVPQYIQPTIDTGFVDIKGNWKGVRSSDETFKIDATHEGVPNGAAVLSPQAQPDFIDMTGYSSLYIAIKPSNAGNVAITAVMGPDTNTFANLTPVNAATTLRFITDDDTAQNQDLRDCFNDAAEQLAADVWNIYNIQNVVSNQKVLQFKITNNSGGSSDIDFAYMRIV